MYNEQNNRFTNQMHGEYEDSSATITKAAAEAQTTNGTATEPTSTDFTGGVSYKNGEISFSLPDAAAYRTAEANKAIPSFDATNYGLEDYVFGNSGQYARTGTVSCWRFLNPY